MMKPLKFCLIACTLLLVTSCALFRTSMSPGEVAGLLPTMTETRFMTVAQAENAVQSGRARFLVRREYTAPIAMSTNGDLRNGARGIDEWVKLDGGNAYVLVNYNWVRVDDEGSTQLFLEFDTMLVE